MTRSNGDRKEIAEGKQSMIQRDDENSDDDDDDDDGPE